MKANLDFDLCNPLHREALRYMLALLDSDSTTIAEVTTEEKPKPARAPCKTKEQKEAEKKEEAQTTTQPKTDNPFGAAAPQTIQTTNGGFVAPTFSSAPVFAATQAPPAQTAPIQGASVDAMAQSGNLYTITPDNAYIAPVDGPQVPKSPDEYTEDNLRAVFVAKAADSIKAASIIGAMKQAGFNSIDEMSEEAKRAFFNFMLNIQ